MTRATRASTKRVKKKAPEPEWGACGRCGTRQERAVVRTVADGASVLLCSFHLDQVGAAK